MSLKGKKIVLGISGSIAAYKTPHLVRLLVKAGAQVRVITTPAANSFVSPLSLATVSKNPVWHNVSQGDEWNNHVELGLWADLMLIAPCSANTMAKLALGICDNLLCAVYLSARCPVMLAPAMDEDMWKHSAVQHNLQLLLQQGKLIIPVAHGELASGLIGEGRMAEPEAIVNFISHYFNPQPLPLHGMQALVTAGPTYERIDPVRFIGNFSTGKMGIALAEALAAMGAKVLIIKGPGAAHTHKEGITTVQVESAEQMYSQAMQAFPKVSIAVLSAAVADYKPAQIADNKIKKSGDTLDLRLVKTPDILASLGKVKTAGQVLVGFALETSNELENAQQKLKAKNADMIVLNSLNDEGAGFGHDTNKITLITHHKPLMPLPLQTKALAAEAIVNQIVALLHEQNPS
jgi:phosphopantothenoylcysteine decarboxylase/phosphopantothenate--cysteine ligase